MQAIKNLLTSRPVVQSSDSDSGAAAAAAPHDGNRSLQDRFEAQTARLREIYKAQRPKNTRRAYEPKQKEWEDWCTKLEDNTDGFRVTEDKLCLFLEQEVINRESRAAGYTARKTKRKETWKDSERAKKKQKTATAAVTVVSGLFWCQHCSDIRIILMSALFWCQHCSGGQDYLVPQKKCCHRKACCRQLKFGPNSSHLEPWGICADIQRNAHDFNDTFCFSLC